MDLHHLKYVLTIIEEESFTKAAKKLYISQPSLSQYILKLEKQLGVQLFNRTTTPISLTNVGEIYASTAKQILNLKEEFSLKVEEINGLKKGNIRIGISPLRSAYLLPKILPKFHEKFPGISIYLFEGSASYLHNLINKGDIDLILMALPEKSDHFRFKIIQNEEIIVALPPNHILKDKLQLSSNETYPKVSLEDLKDDSFILLKPGQRLRMITDDLFKKVGFKPRIILETQSIETAHSLTSAGMGVTFIRNSVVDYSDKSSKPVYCSLGDLTPETPLVIVYSDTKYLSKASQEFIKLVEEVLNK